MIKPTPKQARVWVMRAIKAKGLRYHDVSHDDINRLVKEYIQAAKYKRNQGKITIDGGQ